MLFSHLVASDSLWPPWTVAHQASLSLTISWSLPKFMSIASVMPSSHLILWLFSYCPQSFPASGTFPVSHLFASDDQNTGVSASAAVPQMGICSFNGLPWKTNWDHSLIFEVVPKYCISDSLVDYEGYSISSMEFLPTVVDKMVIWIKFPHSHPF